MRLQFLGTGAAMPTGQRYQSGLLLESGGHSLLIDCGSGVLHRLAETDTGYEELDGLLLSHHHLDHVSDVLPLLKARWLADAGRLPIVGPDGTATLLAELLDVHSYLGGRLEFDVREIEAEAFEVAGFDVEAMEAAHSMPSLAYRLRPSEPTDRPRSTVSVSGDTEAFEELVDFAAGSDALVHDCAFPDDVSVSNHATPSDLGAVLAGSDVGAVYLTHLYPHTVGRHQEMVAAVADRYDGPVTVARDGSAIAI